MSETETDTSSAAEPPSALSPLRIPLFRSVWMATLIAYFGAMIQSVGAAWLMTSLARSADTVALVQSAVTLPFMLLSPVAGALADNLDRRWMMLGAQLSMLFVASLLAACAWTGLITPWLLLLFTFLLASGMAINAPAWQAAVGDMVPRPHLPAAVTLNSVAYNIARSAGPAIGGAVVAAAGAAAAFAVNALSYIALIVVLARWQPPARRATTPRESLGAAIAVGVRYVSQSPTLRTVLLRGFAFGLGTSAVMALLPLVAKHRISGGALTYGVLLGAYGVGAVAGALTATRLRGSVSTEGIVRWSNIVFASITAILAVSTHLWLALPALVIGGGAWVLTLSTFNVTVQLSTPRWVVARALSLYNMTTFGGWALGSWLWGMLAEGHGLVPALLAAAVVTLVSALLGHVFPLTDSEDRGVHPLRPGTSA